MSDPDQFLKEMLAKKRGEKLPTPTTTPTLQPFSNFDSTMSFLFAITALQGLYQVVFTTSPDLKELLWKMALVAVSSFLLVATLIRYVRFTPNFNMRRELPLPTFTTFIYGVIVAMTVMPYFMTDGGPETLYQNIGLISLPIVAGLVLSAFINNDV